MLKYYLVLLNNTLMKERISVTVDKKTTKILDSLLKMRKFRNRSHAVESAIELLEKEEEEK